MNPFTSAEVGSWLMMATELVPGMTPQIGATYTPILDPGIDVYTN